MKLTGIFPPIPTPFNHLGEIYVAKIRHNIEKWNLTSVAGYIVASETGEDVYLGEGEKLLLWEEVAKHSAKTLIAGVSMESVRETVHLAKLAAERGYQAALVRAPRYYRASAELYFSAVADQSPIPVLVPIEMDHPNTLPQPAPQPYACAAPFSCITIAEAIQKREFDAAEDWQRRIAPAVDMVTVKYGIPGLKYAMDFNGYYGGPPRLPLLPIPAAAQQEIEAAFHGLRG